MPRSDVLNSMSAATRKSALEGGGIKRRLRLGKNELYPQNITASHGAVATCNAARWFPQAAHGQGSLFVMGGDELKEYNSAGTLCQTHTMTSPTYAGKLWWDSRTQSVLGVNNTSIFSFFPRSAGPVQIKELDGAGLYQAVYDDEMGLLYYMGATNNLVHVLRKKGFNFDAFFTLGIATLDSAKILIADKYVIIKCGSSPTYYFLARGDDRVLYSTSTGLTGPAGQSLHAASFMVSVSNNHLIFHDPNNDTANKFFVMDLDEFPLKDGMWIKRAVAYDSDMPALSAAILPFTGSFRDSPTTYDPVEDVFTFAGDAKKWQYNFRTSTENVVTYGDGTSALRNIEYVNDELQVSGYKLGVGAAGTSNVQRYTKYELTDITKHAVSLGSFDSVVEQSPEKNSFKLPLFTFTVANTDKYWSRDYSSGFQRANNIQTMKRAPVKLDIRRQKNDDSWTDWLTIFDGEIIEEPQELERGQIVAFSASTKGYFALCEQPAKDVGRLRVQELTLSSGVGTLSNIPVIVDTVSAWLVQDGVTAAKAELTPLNAGIFPAKNAVTYVPSTGVFTVQNELAWDKLVVLYRQPYQNIEVDDAVNWVLDKAGVWEREVSAPELTAADAVRDGAWVSEEGRPQSAFDAGLFVNGSAICAGPPGSGIIYIAQNVTLPAAYSYLWAYHISTGRFTRISTVGVLVNGHVCAMVCSDDTAIADRWIAGIYYDTDASATKLFRYQFSDDTYVGLSLSGVTANEWYYSNLPNYGVNTARVYRVGDRMLFAQRGTEAVSGLDYAAVLSVNCDSAVDFAAETTSTVFEYGRTTAAAWPDHTLSCALYCQGGNGNAGGGYVYLVARWFKSGSSSHTLFYKFPLHIPGTGVESTTTTTAYASNDLSLLVDEFYHINQVAFISDYYVAVSCNYYDSVTKGAVFIFKSSITGATPLFFDYDTQREGPLHIEKCYNNSTPYFYWVSGSTLDTGTEGAGCLNRILSDTDVTIADKGSTEIVKDDVAAGSNFMVNGATVFYISYPSGRMVRFGQLFGARITTLDTSGYSKFEVLKMLAKETHSIIFFLTNGRAIFKARGRGGYTPSASFGAVEKFEDSPTMRCIGGTFDKTIEDEAVKTVHIGRWGTTPYYIQYPPAGTPNPAADRFGPRTREISFDLFTQAADVNLISGVLKSYNELESAEWERVIFQTPFLEWVEVGDACTVRLRLAGHARDTALPGYSVITSDEVPGDAVAVTVRNVSGFAAGMVVCLQGPSWAAWTTISSISGSDVTLAHVEHSILAADFVRISAGIIPRWDAETQSDVLSYIEAVSVDFDSMTCRYVTKHKRPSFSTPRWDDAGAYWDAAGKVL